MIRAAYVSLVKGVRRPLQAYGTLSWLERRQSSTVFRWARSLFSIYDIDDMVHLDLPWWTLRAAQIVDQFLRQRPHARVFEYGSGASTIFLARRAKTVESVEHDSAWWQRLRPVLQPFTGANCTLVEPHKSSSPEYASQKRGHRGLEFRDYVHSIDRTAGQFDLIVVDGRCRSRCLQAAAGRLAADGMIVFDNSGRSRYRAAIANSGLHAIRTWGLTAALPYPDQTTLLFRDPRTRDAALYPRRPSECG